MTIKEKRILKLGRLYLKKYSLNEWNFKINYTAKKRNLGLCSYYSKKISLSKKLCDYGNLKEIKNTLLHEIAHAIDTTKRGYSKHDKKWRSIALSIGCNGLTRSKISFTDKLDYKHLYQCKECKHIFGAYRKLKNHKIRRHKNCKNGYLIKIK